MNQQTLKIDDKVMKLLGASEVRRLICNTNKGKLELMIRKGDNKYFLTLDSIPLDEEINKELMDLMFKQEIPQVNKEITVGLTTKNKVLKKVK